MVRLWPWVVEGKLPAPQARVQATHAGDGSFVVRLGFTDGTEQLLFQATGIYTSPAMIAMTTNILTVTAQATGSWELRFQRMANP